MADPDSFSISTVAAIAGARSGHMVINTNTHQVLAATAPTRTVPQVFFCAGQIRCRVLNELERQLRLRGIQVWAAPESGTTLRQRLATTDLALIYLSAASTTSEAALQQELTAVWEHYAQATPLRLLVLLNGIERETAVQILRRSSRSPSKLSALMLTPDSSELTRIEEIAQVARIITHATIPPYLHQRRNAERAVEISLSSFPQTATAQQGQLCLDWHAYFPVQHPFLPLPMPAAWDTVLLAALDDLRVLIGEAQIERIRLYPHAHLSIGLAMGYVFRAVTNFAFEIAQTTATQTNWWSTQASPAQDTSLQVAYPAVAANGDDVSIELNISRSVDRAVADAIRSRDLPIGKRIAFSLYEGFGDNVVRDSSHAMAIAQQIGRAIKAERDYLSPRETIHIFGAMPFALALMIGRQLNRCGPIRCYEFLAGRYYPACALGE